MPFVGRKVRLLLRLNDGYFFERGIGVVVGRVESFLTFESGDIL